jgi:tRNA (guanine26-N2/guanine27-N2)-dimethyltransferase
METQLVAEGHVKLEVPELSLFRTAAGDYAPSLTPVFYNPRMELCRDISVAVAQVMAGKLGKLLICDPLSGVGVRGIRYAKEVKDVSEVVANDRSLPAYQLILHNIKLNRMEGLVEARQGDANALLSENRGRFNFIDLDPFGSPAPFLEAACASIGRRGMLAITATDTAPLCGAGVRACLRRYGAQPLKTEYCRELGVRILTGFAQRVAGKHELALVPTLSHATQHYFRVYLWAERGTAKVDETLKKQGYVSHCFRCDRRFTTTGAIPKLPATCSCGGELSHAGPLWLGPLAEKELAENVVKDLERGSFRQVARELSLMTRCVEEAGGPPTFYEINEIARREKCQPPKIAKVIEGLETKGYFASRTHFLETGFRTSAPIDEISETFKSD